LLLTAASSIYGAAATWRRSWYGRAQRQRRLDHPVVSVGNLRMGGAGKTPTVAYIAQLLAARGERPAILSRGYARRKPVDGVTVVSDGRAVLATVDHAGDEPLMLARALPGVPVLVGSDRFLSGLLAERRLGATVHLLDDGFQHLELARDVDLLLVSQEDLNDRVVPAGHLREPIAAASCADALLAAEEPGELERLRAALGIRTAFGIRAAQAELRLLGPGTAPSRSTPLFAVAAIARPERFAAGLRAGGWNIAGTMAFRDHHRFGAADLQHIVAAARRAGADAIVTTEKDAVRLESCMPAPIPVAVAPLQLMVEPAAAFAEWLAARLRGTS
jgi:tetraacyldisaccharide 4'-kinase